MSNGLLERLYPLPEQVASVPGPLDGVLSRIEGVDFLYGSGSGVSDIIHITNPALTDHISSHPEHDQLLHVEGKILPVEGPKGVGSYLVARDAAKVLLSELLLLKPSTELK